MKKLVLLFVCYWIVGANVHAQDYVDALKEGKRRYAQELYYEAYLRFNAAEVNSKQFQDAKAITANQEARTLLEKAVKGIITQQAKTDSLIKRNQAIIDQFYFYDGRLALAYKNNSYGFINKKGEEVIPYQYDQATNFDEETGYAQVEKEKEKFWLSPEGKKYPIATHLEKLPKITKANISKAEASQINAVEDLSQYKTTSNSNHHQALNEGIDKYHQRLFYDAFIRFNASTYSEDKALAKFGEELKQKSITQIRLSFTQAEEALNDTKRLLNAFYYAYDKFALAYNNGKYYFIDKQGKVVEKLGRWDYAENFSTYDYSSQEIIFNYAKVKKYDDIYTLDNIYALDTLGNTYNCAYNIEKINSNTAALFLDNRIDMHKNTPNQLFNNKQLKILGLNGYHSSNFSKYLCELTNLTHLYYKSLQEDTLKIPKEVSQLKNLELLDVGGYGGGALPRKLPEEIKNLKRLKYLNLYNCALGEIIPEVFELENLKYLHIGGNFLKNIPENIGRLKNLETLILDWNGLTELPNSFKNLKKLKYLSFIMAGSPLYSNSFKSFPEILIELKNLEKLEIGTHEDSTYKYLPENFTNMEKLKEISVYNFDLNNNIIPKFPKSLIFLNINNSRFDENNLTHKKTKNIDIRNLIHLNNLKVLTLKCNIDILPTDISHLTKLTTLYLSGNKLSILPAEIGALKNLNSLDLSYNYLKKLPLEIGNLENLTELNLSSNQLTDIPIEVGNLEKLGNLNLMYNENLDVSSVCIAFANFSKKIILCAGYGSNNQNGTLLINIPNISRLPKEIGKLKNLTDLGLYGNKIRSLPKEIGNLENLTNLDLRNNELANIPKEIENLKKLKILNLEENPILPEEIEKVKKLLPNCKILHDKIDYFEIGQKLFDEKKYKEALDAYLKDIEQGKENYNIISFGNAGLCYRLLENNEKALEYLKKYLELEPNDIWTLKQLRITYAEMKDYKNAYPYTKQLVEEEKEKYEHWFNLSFYALFVGKPAEAIDAAQKSLQLAPEKNSVIRHLVRGYVLNNQWDKAEPLYKEWENKKFNGDSYLTKQIFLTDIEDLEEAGIKHNDFTRVRELLIVYFKIAQKLFDEKKHQEALDAYLKDIEQGEGNYTIASFGNAGLCYRLLGNNEKALEYLKKYLELKPNNIWTLKQLRITYAEMKDYKNAYPYTKQLTENEQEKTKYTHWYNLSYYALFVGKPQEVIEAAQKSLSLSPEKNGVISNLVLGYVLNNQWDKAEPLYKEWKNKSFKDDKRLAKEVFLADIADLEKAGITHKDFEKVKKIMQE